MGLPKVECYDPFRVLSNKIPKVKIMSIDVGMGFPLFLTMGFPSTSFGYAQPNIASFLRQALRFPSIGSTHLV